MKYQRGNIDVEALTVIVFLLVVFATPAYYFGKHVQRTENRFNCREFSKIELNNPNGANFWVACEYPKEGQNESKETKK